MKIFSALPLCLLVVVSACGDSGSDETTVATEPQPTTPATPASEDPSATADIPTTEPDDTSDATSEPTGGTTDASPTTGPSTMCEPGAQDYCYSGDFGSDGTGICIGGLATCLPDGTGYGPCEGEVVPQPEDCDSPEDENCDGLAGCPVGTELWSHSFGDGDPQWSADIVLTIGDALITTGIFQGTIDLGGGPLVSTDYWDTYLAKFDGEGTHVWSKAFGGGSGSQTVEAGCSDPAGAIYITGGFDSDIDLGGGVLDGAFGVDSGFLAKYGPDGAFMWAKAFVPVDESQSIYLSTLDCDAAGPVIGGFTGDNVDFGGGVLAGGGDLDVVLARFDAAGNHVWSRRFGDTEDQYMGGVGIAPNGDVAVCGELSGAADFGGGDVASNGGSDVFIARLDATGAHVWSHAYGSDSLEQCDVLAIDSQGAVVIAGDYYTGFDLGGELLADGSLFLAKYAADGSHQWSRGFGSVFLAAAERLAIDSTDKIYLSGYYDEGFGTYDIGVELPSSSSFAVFAATYTAGGLPVWARAYDGEGDDLDTSIAVDSLGDILLTGRFDTSLDFGNGAHVSSGDFDVFIAKIRIE